MVQGKKMNGYYFRPAVPCTTLTHTATEDALSSHFPAQSKSIRPYQSEQNKACDSFGEID